MEAANPEQFILMFNIVPAWFSFLVGAVIGALSI